MPATSAQTVVQNDVSHTSGTTNSSWRDVRTAYTVHVDVRITNGGTGPTAPVSVRLEFSYDNGSNIHAQTADMPADDANSAVTGFPFDFKGGIYYRIVTTGGGTNAVTIRTEESVITA